MPHLSNQTSTTGSSNGSEEDARENTAVAPDGDFDRKPKKEKKEGTSKPVDQAGPEKGSKSVRKGKIVSSRYMKAAADVVVKRQSRNPAEMEHLQSSFSAATFGRKSQTPFSASSKSRIPDSTPRHIVAQQGRPDWTFLSSSLASGLTRSMPRWDVSSVLPTLCESELTSEALFEADDPNEIPKVKTSAVPVTEEDLKLLHTDYLMSHYAEMQMQDLSRRMNHEMRSALVAVWQQKQEALMEKHRLELLLQRIKQDQHQYAALTAEKAFLTEQLKSFEDGFIATFTECGRALETASRSLPTRNLHGSEEPCYTASNNMLSICWGMIRHRRWNLFPAGVLYLLEVSYTYIMMKERLREQLDVVMNESELLKNELSSRLSGLQPVTDAASQLRQTTSLLVAEVPRLLDCQQQFNDLVLEEASLLLQQEELAE